MPTSRPPGRYVTMALAVTALVVALALGAAGQGDASRWFATAFVLGFILWTVIGMVRDVLHGHVGLDVLAIAAMGATLAVGEYIAALIIVLMLAGGEALEYYASRRAQSDLSALLDRTPRLAHVIGTHSAGAALETIEDVPVESVAVGDLLLVRPGETVPVDGSLLSDAALFDESSLTGESLPVVAAQGAEVPSGAVNGAAAVRLRALRTSADSQYQQIVALVHEAQTSKAPVVRLADRFAVPFTAVALVLAATAWILSGEATRFAEVLVLATPCPLLIAAPVAFLGGLSRAAKTGVIMKSGAVIERLARVRSVAFDKTGTLTRGDPVLVDVRPADGFSAEDVLLWAASAEQYSSHVLADGLRQAAAARGMKLLSGADGHEDATNGVSATIDHRRVVVGKPSYVASIVGEDVRTPLRSGQAAAYVAVDGAHAGALVLADAPRSEAARVVAWLRSHGVERVVMLTGDVEPTARAVARVVGIEEVCAELHPAEKVRLAGDLQPRPMTMIGDGINDAPVLAASDVGIAMGARGATAAGEAADVVILIDSLDGVVDAVAVSRHTLRVALTAIWIGMGASVALMLVAMGGFIPAVIGALLQEAVDVATILYALRALSGPKIEIVPVTRR